MKISFQKIAFFCKSAKLTTVQSCVCKYNKKRACFMKSEFTGRKLLSPEREKLIVDSLAGGIRTIAELSEKLGVSEATVRRDLQSLEERNLVRRVHGGAEPVRQGGKAEPMFNEKTSLHATEKELIAKRAMDFIQDNDAIFLDGGSTVLALAHKLKERKNLTIVTNSLMAASELMETSHRLILLGGEFRARSRTLVGPLTSRILDSLAIHTAFMGTMGFTAEAGISTSDPNEAYTKEEVMRHSSRVVLLADSSKLGTPSLAGSGNVDNIDIIITDNKVSAELEAKLAKKHIEVIRTGIIPEKI